MKSLKRVLFITGLILLTLTIIGCTGAATVPTAAPATSAPQPTAVAPTSAPQPTAAPATSAPQPTNAPATNAPQPTTASATSASATSAPSASAGKGKICMITDTGGIADKAFNQTAWQGTQNAAQKLGWEATYLESRQQTDYEKNIGEFIKSGCNLIVTVGFLMGDATGAAAKQNPDQKFAIMDFAYDPPLPNVWGQLYAMEQPTFLAGYLAAGMSKTGKVGVFGGLNIPPVADFFIGLQEGVKYYNKQKSKNVQFLGWSNEKLDGLFVGSFTDADGGRRFAENLMDEGVDVILPQGGPEGLAAANAMKQRGNVLMIGVDTDQVISAPENSSVTLTSAIKHLEISVQQAAEAVADGSFKGGTHVGTLQDGGVDVTPFHEFEDKVPADLKAELAQIRADIIAGKIQVPNWVKLKSGQ